MRTQCGEKQPGFTKHYPHIKFVGGTIYWDDFFEGGEFKPYILNAVLREMGVDPTKKYKIKPNEAFIIQRRRI